MGETIARSLTTEYRAYHRARERLVWYGLSSNVTTMKYAEFVERGLRKNFEGEVLDENGNEYRDEQGLAPKVELTSAEAEELESRVYELEQEALGCYLNKSDYSPLEWLDEDEAREYETIRSLLD